MLSGVERTTELGAGLWCWRAFHPSYRQDVTSVLVETADDVVLIDPLAPRDAGGAPFWRALDDAVADGRRLTVALTLAEHARSMPAIAARHVTTTVYAAPAGGGHSVAGVRVEPLAEDAALPAGVTAHATGRTDERALWIAPHGTLVAGDVLLGTDHGGLAVCPAGWLPAGVTRAAVAEALAPLLEQDVRHVVPAHGPPPADARAALAAALAEARTPARSEAR